MLLQNAKDFPCKSLISLALIVAASFFNVTLERLPDVDGSRRELKKIQRKEGVTLIVTEYLRFKKLKAI